MTKTKVPTGRTTRTRMNASTRMVSSATRGTARPATDLLPRPAARRHLSKVVAYGGPTHQHARESGRWKVEATRGEGATEYWEKLRAGFVAGLACAVVAFGGQPDAASGVGPVKVTFSDVIIERTPCKDGQTSAGRQVGGLPGPGNGREMSERPDFTNGCFTVSALANNPGKKELRNADVFGRVYDKYGNTTRDDTENSKNESAPQATPSRF